MSLADTLSDQARAPLPMLLVLACSSSAPPSGSNARLSATAKVGLAVPQPSLVSSAAAASAEAAAPVRATDLVSFEVRGLGAKLQVPSDWKLDGEWAMGPQGTLRVYREPGLSKIDGIAGNRQTNGDG